MAHKVVGEHFSLFILPLLTQSTTNAHLEVALAGFRDDTTLARATVVWKTENGSSRERLLIIRSCARLGRAEVVLELLQHNLRTEALCEDLFLDAVHGDKPTVGFHPDLSRVWLATLDSSTKQPTSSSRFVMSNIYILQ